MSFQGMTIGVPKEIMAAENRVSVTPDIARKLVSQGAKVLVEAEAGKGSYFSDAEYRSAGAEILGDVEELFGKSDLILKVKEPKFSDKKGKHEIDMMKKGQYLITFLHPASPPNHKMIQKLAERGVIGLSLDSIPRISRAQSMDALTAMSTVAGYKAVIMAANILPNYVPMMYTGVGMIHPSNVLVLGTGVAGLQALATAKRLGAVLHASDIRPDACEQAKSLGSKMIDTRVPAEIAIGKGGYASKLPEEWLIKEQQELKTTVAKADIVILTALIPGKVAPILVTDEMVKSMKAGSVIIDVAIDQGGNCEISKPAKQIEQYGVTIDGTLNLPSMVSKSSTVMFADTVYNLVSFLIKKGKISLNLNDEILASALVTNNGKIVHAGTLEAMRTC